MSKTPHSLPADRPVCQAPSVTRVFFDTEFIDRGRMNLELISIGLVDDAGETLYCISNEFDPSHASPWVKENVIATLDDETTWLPQWMIRNRLIDFLKPRQPLELWGWYCAYDFVLLARLFGPLIKNPDYVPNFAHDLKAVSSFLTESWRAPPYDFGTLPHHALDDARWIRKAYRHFREHMSLEQGLDAL